MIPYLLHVSLLIALSYLFYRLLLARETYFQLNRWILSGSVLVAFILPLWQIPQQWTWREATAPMIAEVGPTTPLPTLPTEETTLEHSVTDALQQYDHQGSQPIIQPETSSAVQPLQLSFWLVIKYGYLIGLVILGLNFLIQLMSIAYQRFSRPTIKDGPYHIVELDEDKPPFSFWNSLFINPEKYDWETYNQILQHEKVHLAQRHSFDILLGEILVTLQWFNPLAWLYRKAIEDNLEYLTDATVLQAGADRSTYQLNLLQVAVPSYPLSLANNYNQSTLKKRITMMNAKKSSLQASWKYLFLLPILGLATVALNPIKMTAATTHNKGEQQLESTLFNHSAFAKTGIWSAQIEGSEICFTFNNAAGSNHNWWSSSECFVTSEFTNLPMGQEGEFQLNREAGTITFKGKFEDEAGLGRFSFAENADFKAMLKKKGYNDIDEELMFHFTLNNFNEAYLTFLNSNNLKPKSKDELAGVAFHLPPLVQFKKEISDYKAMGYGDFKLEQHIAMNIHDMSPEYIKALSDAGYSNAPFEQLLAAKIHDVSPEYIREMQAAGFGKLSLEEITQMSIHDVDTEFVKMLAQAGFTDLSREDVLQASIHDVKPEYIKELQEAGFKDLSFDKVVQMSIHDVNADFVKQMAQMGFTNLTENQIMQASIHGVSSDYVQQLKDSGFKDLTIDRVIQMSIHDVDTKFVKELQQMGFTNLSEDQIMQASIHGVSAQYVQELKAAGFKDLSFDKIVQMSIHDVDADFVQELAKMGFTNLSQDQIIQASIHDVSPEYIQELKAAGFKDLSLEKVIQMSIHDVDANFVKKMNQAGYTNLTEDEILQASIHGVDVNQLVSYKQLGFDNIPIQQLIQLNIHDVTPEFIKKAKAKGFEDLGLDEYVRLKIMGFDELGKKQRKQE